ncbi:MAG TPA: TIGR03667 family PPOX class F420-dependent oxidoreductase [Ktedonobacteraceae bacterium]
MAFQLPDPATPFGQQVAKRLQEETVIWLTTVDSKGTPQPAPVWYWWDEEKKNILIYSMNSAKRHKHLRANPRVSVNLDGDKQGGDIIVLTGKAIFSEDDPPAHEHQPFVEKYDARIKSLFGEPKVFADRFSVKLRIELSSIRGQ